MARYRLKYCLKGPLNPKQPTNQIYQVCSFDDLGLTLTFFMANKLDFMESFECLLPKQLVIRVVLMNTLRFMSRRGQGHFLTFDP